MTSLNDTVSPPDHARVAKVRSLRWLADNCPCDVCRAGNRELRGSRVLTPIRPEADESLISLLCRVSASNDLARNRVLLSSISPVWHSHFNLAARNDLDFDRLAFTCRLPRHEVESRRYTNVSISPTLAGFGFHGASIPIYDLQLKARRTTAAWARVGYHSALGHHALITHCPVSGEILIDACPRCSRALNWTAATLSHCSQCGFDLRTHQTARVSSEDQAATELMISILHPDPARQTWAIRQLHPTLRSIDRGTIFELGWRMGSILTGQGLATRNTAKRLAPEQRLRILAEGSRILGSWPESFQQAARGSAGDKNGCRTLASAVASIADAQNSWPELRQVVREAVPALSSGPRFLKKATLVKPATSRELSLELGVSQEVFERMRQSDELQALGSEDRHYKPIFEASGIEDLKQRLGDRISVSKISEALGISRHGVEQLACMGFLEIYDAGAVAAGFKSRQARKSDFELLKTRLVGMGASDAGRFTAGAGVSFDLPMPAAVRAIGGREKPWGPIIAAMLDGRCAFELVEGAGNFMSRVRIARADLPYLACLDFDESRHPTFKFEPGINGRDAEELLNIFPKQLQVAKKAQVVPKPEGRFYDRQAIRALAREYMSAAEAIARCCGEGRELPKPLVGRKAPKRVCAIGWNRVEAEAAISSVDRSRGA